MLLLGLGWFEGGLRIIMALLCSFIYKLIASLFELFINISKVELLSSKEITPIYQRVTMVLTIVMVFYVTFELVKYIIQPDAMKDKEKGASKVVIRMILVVVLIAFVPTAFSYAYKIQNAIIEREVLSKVILGKSNTSSTTFGRNFSADMFSLFYKFDKKYWDESKECDDIDCEKLVDGNLNTLRATGKLENLTYGLNETDTKTENGVSQDIALIRFDGLFAVLVGGFLVYILVLYCIDLGVRVAQITFLQIIAPIPIIGYLQPKKDNMFNKWVKQCLTTYLDLFIRLAIIYFILLVCKIIADAYNNGTLIQGIDDDASTFVYIAVIMGLLLFAQKAPKMLQELFPKMGAASGNFGLKGSERVAPLAARAIGAGTGFARGFIRGQIAKTQNARKRNKDLKEKLRAEGKPTDRKSMRQARKEARQNARASKRQLKGKSRELTNAERGLRGAEKEQKLADERLKLAEKNGSKDEINKAKKAKEEADKKLKNANIKYETVRQGNEKYLKDRESAKANRDNAKTKLDSAEKRREALKEELTKMDENDPKRKELLDKLDGLDPDAKDYKEKKAELMDELKKLDDPKRQEIEQKLKEQEGINERREELIKELDGLEKDNPRRQEIEQELLSLNEKEKIKENLNQQLSDLNDKESKLNEYGRIHDTITDAKVSYNAAEEVYKEAEKNYKISESLNNDNVAKQEYDRTKAELDRVNDPDSNATQEEKETAQRRFDQAKSRYEYEKNNGELRGYSKMITDDMTAQSNLADARNQTYGAYVGVKAAGSALRGGLIGAMSGAKAKKIGDVWKQSGEGVKKVIKKEDEDVQFLQKGGSATFSGVIDRAVAHAEQKIGIKTQSESMNMKIKDYQDKIKLLNSEAEKETQVKTFLDSAKQRSGTKLDAGEQKIFVDNSLEGIKMSDGRAISWQEASGIANYTDGSYTTSTLLQAVRNQENTAINESESANQVYNEAEANLARMRSQAIANPNDTELRKQVDAEEIRVAQLRRDKEEKARIAEEKKTITKLARKRLLEYGVSKAIQGDKTDNILYDTVNSLRAAIDVSRNIPAARKHVYDGIVARYPNRPDKVEKIWGAFINNNLHDYEDVDVIEGLLTNHVGILKNESSIYKAQSDKLSESSWKGAADASAGSGSSNK